MKCHVCGNDSFPQYAHCKSCLEKGLPSGLMEVSFDENFWYVHCKNCGKLVCSLSTEDNKFARWLFEKHHGEYINFRREFNKEFKLGVYKE